MTEKDKISVIFSGAAVIMVGFILEQGITFGSKLIIARFLDAASYGSIGLGFSLMVFCGVVSMAGLNDGLSRYLPRTRDTMDQNALLSTAYITSTALAILSSLVIVIWAPTIATFVGNPESAVVFRVFGLAIPFYVVMRLSIGVIRGLNRSTPRVLLENFLVPLMMFGFMAVAAVLGLGSGAYAGSYLVAYILASIAALYIVSRLLSLPVLPNNLSDVRFDVIRYSVPLIISGVMFRLLSDVDGFLIGYYLQSTEAVGVYRVAYALSRLELMILFGLGYLALPVFSELDAEGDSDGKLVYKLVSKWSTILTTPIFLAFLAYPQTIISHTFGPEYAVATEAFRLLGVGFFVHAFVGPTGDVLKSHGHTKSIMWINVGVMILNLLLNISLIPQYGIVGAAFATAASYILMNTFVTYQLYSVSGIRPTIRGSFWPFTVLSGIFTVVYLGVKALDMNQLASFLLTTGLYTPIFLGLCWVFFISKSEKEAIQDIRPFSEKAN